MTNSILESETYSFNYEFMACPVNDQLAWLKLSTENPGQKTAQRIHSKRFK
jgi:hypothetical protein